MTATRSILIMGTLALLSLGPADPVLPYTGGAESVSTVVSFFESIEPSALDQWIAPIDEWCHDCDDLCSMDEWQRHETQFNPQGDWSVPEPSPHTRFHGCTGATSQGECEDFHVTGCTAMLATLPGADGVEADLRAFVNNLLHESFDVVKGIVALNPDHLRFDRERHALQIVGCEGSIVAHIPISPLAMLH